MFRLLFVLALLAAWPAAAGAEEVRLTILHTTDLHGALTAWDYPSDRPAPRGLVRLAALVRQVRAEGGPVLLLDAGDCIQGSAISDTWRRQGMTRPEPMTAAMAVMGYDAMAVGN